MKTLEERMPTSLLGDALRAMATVGGLILLALLIDQVQEGFCRVFDEVRERTRSTHRLNR